MRFQGVFAVLMILSLTLPLHYTEGESEVNSLLVELPSGQVFWLRGNGYNSTLDNLTRSICKANNLTLKLTGTHAIIAGYYLSLYHWDNGWKSGIGSISAWSQGIPVATPMSPYPRTTALSQVSHFSAGPDEVWRYSVGSGIYGSVDSVVTGYSNVTFFNSWNGFYALKDGRLMWKNSTVRGLSSPCIYNETIYVGSSDGYLYSFDLHGHLKFRFKISNSPGTTGLSSSPIVVNNTVYIGGFESDNRTSYLFAISSNGTLLWKVALNSSVYYGSPVYHNGILYVPLAGKYNSSTMAWYPDYGVLAIGNGKVIWRFHTDKPVKSTPLFYNGYIYFTCTDGFLYKITEEGNEVWKYRVGYSTSSPNAYDSVIYVGSGSFSTGGRLYAIKDDSRMLWVRNVSGGIQSSITISPPFIFVSVNSEHGGVFCYNFKGKEVWNFTVQNYVLGAPSVIGRFLYFGDDSGHVYALTDNKKPEIVFQGKQNYYFGETAHFIVRATDNVGINNLTVFFENRSYYGNYIYLNFTVNFVGSHFITARAMDYNGNLEVMNYLVNSNNGTMRIIVNIGDKFEVGKNVSAIVEVVDNQGNPVEHACVSVYLDNAIIASGYTVHGLFSFSFTVLPGHHVVKVSVNREGYSSVSWSKNIYGTRGRESNGYNYLPMVISLVAVVVIVAVVLAIILKKRYERYRELTREEMKNK